MRSSSLQILLLRLSFVHVVIQALIHLPQHVTSFPFLPPTFTIQKQGSWSSKTGKVQDLGQLQRPQPIQQQRQQPRSKKPKYYWTNATNLHRELVDLWQETAQVNLTKLTLDQGATFTLPPPIPNQALLNYWKRHDLRAAIASQGGAIEVYQSILCECYPHLLTSTASSCDSNLYPPIIPGNWSDAVQTKIVQQVLANDPNLSATYPPKSPQQLRRLQKPSNPLANNEPASRWEHSPTRKPPGYWSSDRVVLQELFEYLDQRQTQHMIPAVWMPRLADISNDGREDLALAIRRFGGAKKMRKKAGLVSYSEWKYMDGMYELLVLLKEYIEKEETCTVTSKYKYKTFPVVSKLSQRGYSRLYHLIQYYGGRKFLAARLDMNGQRRRDSNGVADDSSWGPFDLEFGIEIYSLIRFLELRKQPPLQRPELFIPSQHTLLVRLDEWKDPYWTKEKGLSLDKKIHEYGGYENVARRLGLAYAYR